MHSLKEQPGAQQTISSPIRPIDELNSDAGEINSHAEETALSRLEMNYRQYIELTSEQLGTRKATYPRLKPVVPEYV